MAFADNSCDHGMNQPCGSAIRPVPVMTAEGEVDGTVSLTIETPSFVITRWDLTFPEDLTYDPGLRPMGGTLLREMTLLGAVGPGA
jgi:hypothetical protein